MRVLRLKIHQNKAHYKKYGSVENKETYSLPPFSTIIGAIHYACGYKEYHPMDISVQGTFDTMTKEIYVNHCKANTIQTDRGILVKFDNPNILSTDFIEVASSLESKGNCMIEEKTIDIHRRDLLTEYQNAREEKNKEVLKYFGTILKIPQSYEVLHNVDLIIHIRSDEKTLQDVYDNQYNLVALGRTEDTIELKEIKFVELTNDIEDEVIDNLKNNNMMYVSKEAFNKEELFFDMSKVDEEMDVQGTKYFINKDYKIVKNKRMFNTKEVILTSGFGLSYDDKEHMYIDEDKNIVELL